MLRSHEAGSLRKSNAGQTVTLAGWVSRRRDHGGVAFIDLRDASGSVQVVIRDEKVAGSLRAEWCLLITGEVVARPAGNENTNIPTGEIEVMGDTVVVLSEAAPLPFPVDSGDDTDINEEVRLRYRYLDLRREKPAQNLRLRSKVTSTIRRVMEDDDEDFRADRQPEFTQLDIEMSFIDQEDILAVAEKIVARVWKEAVNYDIPLPLKRMTYADAMTNYGSDKPDLRFSNQLVDLTSFFAQTPFRVFQAPYVGAVVMPGGASSARRELDAWQDWAKARGAKGLAYILVNEDGTLGGPVSKNISDQETAGIVAASGAKLGDAIFFAAGERTASLNLLGAVRLEIGKRCNLIPDGQWEFLWVVDAHLPDQSLNLLAHLNLIQHLLWRMHMTLFLMELS